MYRKLRNILLILSAGLMLGCAAPRPSVSFADPWKALYPEQGAAIGPTAAVGHLTSGWVTTVNGAGSDSDWDTRNFYVMVKLTWEW
jgi:hypothetical protein